MYNNIHKQLRTTYLNDLFLTDLFSRGVHFSIHCLESL